MAESIYDRIREEAQAMKDEIIAWRHHLHENPELSFKEEKTTAFVAEKLRSFGYKDVTTGFGPLSTGVMASIGSGRPCVALRADMDALPVTEQTGLSYASKTEGVMHACGHDAHTASLLAVAKILKKFEPELKGRVKLIFQPAEETRIKIFEKPLSGSSYVIRSGAIDDVDAVFGMHVWGIFEKGKIFVKPGPTMMASARFRLKIIGKGTHGASPHLGFDPIATGCQIVNGIQTIVSRETSPIDPALITVATFHGGTATNIVPPDAEISGTIRGAREETVRFMGKRLGEVAELTAKAHRCQVEYHLLINGPAVENDPAMAAIVRDAAGKIVGEARVSGVDMLTASEDFREYSSRKPSALYFLGMKEEEKGIGQPQHDPAFRVNDDVMADSPAVMAAIAFRYLEEHA